MPKDLNIEKLEKRFSTVTRSKESIQSLSLWVIYHKQYRDEICRYWLTALEKGDPTHRLTLFYVANEVLQLCKRKSANEYRISFAEVLEDAMLLTRNDAVCNDILRMISIWSERNVYSSDYLSQLTDVLNSKSDQVVDVSQNREEETDDAGTNVADESVIIANFKPKQFVSCLQQLNTLKKDVSAKEQKVAHYYDSVIPKLTSIEKKPVAESEKCYKRMDTTCKVTESYLSALDAELAAKRKATKQLENSIIFYTKQNDEVKHVVHAYRVFGKRLKLMEQKLKEKIEMLPIAIETSAGSPSIASFERTDNPGDNENCSKIICPVKQQQNETSLDSRLTLLFQNKTSAVEKGDSTPSDAGKESPQEIDKNTAVIVSERLSSEMPSSETVPDAKQQSDKKLPSADDGSAAESTRVPSPQNPPQPVIKSNIEEINTISDVRSLSPQNNPKPFISNINVEKVNVFSEGDSAWDNTKQAAIIVDKVTAENASRSPEDGNGMKVNALDTKLCLLKGMKLLKELMPCSVSPANAKRIDISRTLPLQTIFRVISEGLNPTTPLQRVEKTLTDSSTKCHRIMTEDDLVPVDMELESDDE